MGLGANHGHAGWLRSRGGKNGDMARAYGHALILMRVAPSGDVLSMVRWAVDVNYQPLAVADACCDADPRRTEC